MEHLRQLAAATAANDQLSRGCRFALPPRAASARRQAELFRRHGDCPQTLPRERMARGERRATECGVPRRAHWCSPAWLVAIRASSGPRACGCRHDARLRRCWWGLTGTRGRLRATLAGATRARARWGGNAARASKPAPRPCTFHAPLRRDSARVRALPRPGCDYVAHTPRAAKHRAKRDGSGADAAASARQQQRLHERHSSGRSHAPPAPARGALPPRPRPRRVAAPAGPRRQNLPLRSVRTCTPQRGNVVLRPGCLLVRSCKLQLRRATRCAPPRAPQGGGAGGRTPAWSDRNLEGEIGAAPRRRARGCVWGGRWAGGSVFTTRVLISPH